MENPSLHSTNNAINIVREFIILTKPRVNLLIMFTAIVGMLLAHQSTLNYELIFFASIFPDLSVFKVLVSVTVNSAIFTFIIFI